MFLQAAGLHQSRNLSQDGLGLAANSGKLSTGRLGALVPTGFVTPTSMLPGIFNLAVAVFHLYLTGGVVGD